MLGQCDIGPPLFVRPVSLIAPPVVIATFKSKLLFPMPGLRRGSRKRKEDEEEEEVGPMRRKTHAIAEIVFKNRVLYCTRLCLFTICAKTTTKLFDFRLSFSEVDLCSNVS